MSGKMMYLVLETLLLFSSGAAIAAGYAAAKNRFPKWWSYFTVKLGVIGTNSIIFLAVFENQTAPVTWPSVLYSAFLFITAVGLIFVTGDLAKRSGFKAVNHVLRTHAEQENDTRVSNLENRVTIEEARNTDIEQLARDHKAGVEHEPSEQHQEEESVRKIRNGGE